MQSKQTLAGDQYQGFQPDFIGEDGLQVGEPDSISETYFTSCRSKKPPAALPASNSVL